MMGNRGKAMMGRASGERGIHERCRERTSESSKGILAHARRHHLRTHSSHRGVLRQLRLHRRRHLHRRLHVRRLRALHRGAAHLLAISPRARCYRRAVDHGGEHHRRRRSLHGPLPARQRRSNPCGHGFCPQHCKHPGPVAVHVLLAALPARHRRSDGRPVRVLGLLHQRRHRLPTFVSAHPSAEHHRYGAHRGPVRLPRPGRPARRASHGAAAPSGAHLLHLRPQQHPGLPIPRRLRCRHGASGIRRRLSPRLPRRAAHLLHLGLATGLRPVLHADMRPAHVPRRAPPRARHDRGRVYHHGTSGLSQPRSVRCFPLSLGNRSRGRQHVEHRHLRLLLVRHHRLHQLRNPRPLCLRHGRLGNLLRLTLPRPHAAVLHLPVGRQRSAHQLASRGSCPHFHPSGSRAVHARRARRVVRRERSSGSRERAGQAPSRSRCGRIGGSAGRSGADIARRRVQRGKTRGFCPADGLRGSESRRSTPVHPLQRGMRRYPGAASPDRPLLDLSRLRPFVFPLGDDAIASRLFSLGRLGAIPYPFPALHGRAVRFHAPQR